MKKHVNIPVFVTHMGCPHMCVFCNQKTISGHEKPDFSGVRDEISKALETTDAQKQEIQIAFFGGSFTGIDRADMIFLLSVAKEFIDAGRAQSIRLSTRPDYIDEEIIGILKQYGVKTVELGIQSCSDSVLSVCERGHDFTCSKKAAEMLVSAGLEFVGQMMTGLPSSIPEDELMTAREIVKMGAVAARIYPTVVFRGTELARMAENGLYIPLTREETLTRAEAVFEVFACAGVNVIRIGLQSSEALVRGDEIACGDYCESIGEMCKALYFEKRITALCENRRGERAVVLVNPKRISCAVGYGGENKRKIAEKLGLSSLEIKADGSLSEYEIKIKED